MAVDLTKVPGWAWRTATAADWQAVGGALQDGRARTNWYQVDDLRGWARAHRWPTPWFGFQDAFLRKMTESEDAFALVLAETRFEVQLLKPSYALPADEVQDLDALYEARDYRVLVEGLRDIRRAVEAGVVVEVDGRRLTSFNTFYSWAHGRYYALEDDTGTGWIGDDSKHPYG